MSLAVPRSTIIPASATGAPVQPVLSLTVLSSTLISVRFTALSVPVTLRFPSTVKLPPNCASLFDPSITNAFVPFESKTWNLPLVPPPPTITSVDVIWIEWADIFNVSLCPSLETMLSVTSVLLITTFPESGDKVRSVLFVLITPSESTRIWSLNVTLPSDESSLIVPSCDSKCNHPVEATVKLPSDGWAITAPRLVPPLSPFCQSSTFDVCNSAPSVVTTPLSGLRVIDVPSVEICPVAPSITRLLLNQVCCVDGF